MKHLFVPYEIALKLKENGFDEPCLAKYRSEKNFSEVGEVLQGCDLWNGVFHTNLKNPKYSVSAPLYQQVVDWFRDVKGICIDVRTVTNLKVWDYRIVELNKDYGNSFYDGIKPTSAFGTFYESLDKAIEEALKLI